MADQIEVHRRREQVKHLIAMGTSNVSEIARITKMSVPQAFRDIATIKKEFQAQMKTKNAEEFVVEFMTAYNLLAKEFWKLYVTSNNDNVKLGALNSFKELVNDKIKGLQMLGLIDKPADKIKIEGQVTYHDFAKYVRERDGTEGTDTQEKDEGISVGDFLDRADSEASGDSGRDSERRKRHGD